jgi:hypothetical protein
MTFDNAKGPQNKFLGGGSDWGIVLSASGPGRSDAGQHFDQDSRVRHRDPVADWRLGDIDGCCCIGEFGNIDPVLAI